VEVPYRQLLVVEGGSSRAARDSSARWVPTRVPASWSANSLNMTTAHSWAARSPAVRATSLPCRGPGIARSSCPRPASDKRPSRQSSDTGVA
jgi:hypothetical protein